MSLISRAAAAAAISTVALLGVAIPSADAKRCDSSYKGACLKPNVSDYDCAGGSGNGPYYVSVPVRIVGDDHYRLDNDGDGWGCERN